ncbi:MAG: ATP-binding domain-containing protein [Burkholderiales bacterium]|nr:ATP-binding domain-containing protein [Burkholderiales bacterium]
MKGRNLQVDLHVATFAPIGNVNEQYDGDYPVCNADNLDSWINGLEDKANQVYEATLAVIQSISTIRKGRKKREVRKQDSRGAKLKDLEDSIANLDNLQGRAVIETVEGVQRIRGLAGSGKTIVLALKAAYLHAQHPDWKIAVTFHTRSLKGQFKRLINTFVIEQTNEEPDWDNLHIIHAWGAPGGTERNGLYYSFCQAHGLEFFDFKSAQFRFGENQEFEGACEKALQEAIEENPAYNVILIDEAQDFSPAFLRLCYEFVGADKRLVYAYDELQNLSNKSLPSPEEIFGHHPDGTPRVRFAEPQLGMPQQDVILEKCYRNSRPVLATAHALGFGIYREPPEKASTGLIQMFDQSKLWLDVGYKVVGGKLEDGSDVRLARTEDSSPKFLESHSSVDDLLQFQYFDTPQEQAEWLTNAIKYNLEEDELQPDDIIVINPDPLTTRKVVGPIRKLLFECKINSHLAGVDTSPDIFFDADAKSIAFTGIYRAKGNEAGMVYVINAQDCYSSFGNLARVRNRLFTAITRSKAWVRVLGVGKGMKKLMAEFDTVKKDDFELRFRYPTEEERKQLNIVNRDMTEDEKKRVKQVQKGSTNLDTLLNDLESGKVFLEDLREDQLKRLRSLFGGGNA